MPSDIGKWAWMPLRHTGTPRTMDDNGALNELEAQKVLLAHNAANNVTSVRGDALGLLRRTQRWTDPLDLYIHPRTVTLDSPSPPARG